VCKGEDVYVERDRIELQEIGYIVRMLIFKEGTLPESYLKSSLH
jgi:hypothetical protein